MFIFRSNRRYGNVPLDYGNRTVAGNYTEDEEEVRSGAGVQLSEIYLPKPTLSKTRKEGKRCVEGEVESEEVSVWSWAISYVTLTFTHYSAVLLDCEIFHDYEYFFYIWQA